MNDNAVTDGLVKAFRAWQDAMIELDRTWTNALEQSGMHAIWGDVIHHVCAAMSSVDAPYDDLDGAQEVLAREAFLSALALGQLVRRAKQERSAELLALAGAAGATDKMLDALAPCVSGADLALRAALLDGDTIDVELYEA
jgi:hypothetical protein